MRKATLLEIKNKMIEKELIINSYIQEQKSKDKKYINAFNKLNQLRNELKRRLQPLDDNKSNWLYNFCTNVYDLDSDIRLQFELDQLKLLPKEIIKDGNIYELVIKFSCKVKSDFYPNCFIRYVKNDFKYTDVIYIDVFIPKLFKGFDLKPLNISNFLNHAKNNNFDNYQGN